MLETEFQQLDFVGVEQGVVAAFGVRQEFAQNVEEFAFFQVGDEVVGGLELERRGVVAVLASVDGNDFDAAFLTGRRSAVVAVVGDAAVFANVLADSSADRLRNDPFEEQNELRAGLVMFGIAGTFDKIFADREIRTSENGAGANVFRFVAAMNVIFERDGDVGEERVDDVAFLVFAGLGVIGFEVGEARFEFFALSGVFRRAAIVEEVHICSFKFYAVKDSNGATVKKADDARRPLDIIALGRSIL